jgi:hypothetical protein
MEETKYDKVQADNVAKVKDEEVVEKVAAVQEPVEEGRAKKAPIIQATKKKQGVFKRLTVGLFGPDKLRNIGGYIGHDVILPAIKDMTSTGLKTVVDMVLYGGPQGANRTNWSQPRGSYYGYGSNNRTNYGRAYNQQYSQQRYGTGQVSLGSGSSPRDMGDKYTDYRSIVMPNHTAARQVLEQMQMDINEHGVVTIADFLDYTGWGDDVSMTDNMYGWRTLVGVQPRPARGGTYELSLPVPTMV